MITALKPITLLTERKGGEIMKIWYYVNDKKTGIILAEYNTLEEARKHARKSENYFVSLRWDY